MANSWEFGLAPEPFAQVESGAKLIEGRLNRGKFAQFRPGDIVSLRADYYDAAGKLQDGRVGALQLEVVSIRHYDSFLEMVAAEGYDRVIPSASNDREAADEYARYYSADDESNYGVIAIEIRRRQ